MTTDAMTAVVATRAGGPEVLAVEDRPRPRPGPGEILVQVTAAGVNFIDTYRRSGIYPVDFPHVVGSEGAGHVVDVGEGVEGFAEGDAVAWADAPGSYATYVVVRADRALAVPGGVGLDIAAALPLQGLTAHYLAASTFPISSGHRALVHAGAGGVGLLLTQLVTARGGEVIATVSTAEKEELARAAGARHVIRYTALDDLDTELPALVRQATDGHGVDVVYDGVGRTTFDASLASLRQRGTLVLFGGASGQVPPFDLQRLNAGGSLFITRPTLAHYVADRTELEWRSDEIFGAVAAGTLDVRIGARHPLAEAAEAHRALEGRHTTGKVILEV